MFLEKNKEIKFIWGNFSRNKSCFQIHYFMTVDTSSESYFFHRFKAASSIVNKSLWLQFCRTNRFSDTYSSGFVEKMWVPTRVSQSRLSFIFRQIYVVLKYFCVYDDHLWNCSSFFSLWVAPTASVSKLIGGERIFSTLF